MGKCEQLGRNPKPERGAKIAVDQVTRIEEHLRIEAELEGGKVVDIWSSVTMLRGIEIILKGRDPRESWAKGRLTFLSVLVGGR